MRVGFVGLGKMGGAIASRILAAGYDLVGYSRTKARAEVLIAAGMGWRDSARQVAEEAEVICTMLPDDEALAAAMAGSKGILAGLQAGAVYVDMSTVSPALTRRLAEQVDARGASMLDAPVSGSPATVEQGRLSFMVGGDTAALERVMPLLLAIGPAATHVGDIGQASLMKLAVNLSVAVQFMVFAEGMVLAEKGGLDRQKALEVIFNSAVASPSIKYRGSFVNEMPEQAWFDVRMMQKDLQLAMEAARELGVALPTTAATSQMLSAASGMGLGDQDFAAIYQVLCRMSGLRT